MMKRTKCEVEKERGSLERGRKEFPDKNSVTKQRKLRQSLRQLLKFVVCLSSVQYDETSERS